MGWEDTLEKGTTTHSSVLAWRIPWTVYLWGRRELYMTERLSLSLNMPLHAGIYFIWPIPCCFQGLGILFNAVMLWKEAGSWSRTYPSLPQCLPTHAFTPSLHSPEVGIIICSTEGAAELSRGVGEVTCASCTVREQETEDPQLLLSSWEAHAPLLTLCGQLLMIGRK